MALLGNDQAPVAASLPPGTASAQSATQQQPPATSTQNQNHHPGWYHPHYSPPYAYPPPPLPQPYYPHPHAPPPPPMRTHPEPPASHPSQYPEQHRTVAALEPRDHDFAPDFTSSSAVVTATTFLSIGSVVGVTAAAAVRWINGGDFSLFPAPSNADATAETMTTTTATETTLQQLREQSDRQTEVLQRMEQAQMRQRNDDCFNLLRGGTTNNNATAKTYQEQAVEESLVALQQELSLLRSDDRLETEAWQQRLDQVVHDISMCLRRVRTSKDSSQESSFEAVQSSAVLRPLIAPCRSLETSLTVDDSVDHPHEFSLDDALLRLKENSPDILQAGAAVLYLYVSKLMQHPQTPRYRKIYTANESFRKVDRLMGGRDVLLAVGFADNGTCLEWLADRRDEEISHYEALLQKATSALKVLKTSGEIPPRDCIAATPPPIVGLHRLHDDDDPCPSLTVQTPEIGSVVSPPATKKQSFPPGTATFPPLHPLAQSTGPLASLEADTAQHSPIRGEDISHSEES